MGKGNRRSKRGKIWRGTYGKYRRRKRKSQKKGAEKVQKPGPEK